MVLWLCFLKSLFISAAVFKLLDIRITLSFKNYWGLQRVFVYVSNTYLPEKKSKGEWLTMKLHMGMERGGKMILYLNYGGDYTTVFSYWKCRMVH